MFRVLSVDSLTIICPRPTLCDNLRRTGGYGGRDGRDGRHGEHGKLSWKKVSRTLQRTCLRLRKQRLVSRHFACGKTLVYFAEDSRVCKHPLLILGQNPPEFSPAGENSVPRQKVKAFNLKFAFIYRSHAPLSRCSPTRQQFARALNL